jgi:50S ribosomal protein L4
MSAQATKKKVTKATAVSGARVLTAQDLGFTPAEKAVKNAGFAIAIRALRQNWRQGTVAVKGRADVSYANRKPWRQKGTGRARAGSARSPLWRHGGVCHGPQPRTRTLSVSTQLKRNVFRSLLDNYLQAGAVLSFANHMEKPSSKLAHTMLRDAGLENKKVMVLVRPDDVATQQSFANLASVKTVLFDQPNAFDLSSCTAWVVFDRDMQQFKDMVGKWH